MLLVEGETDKFIIEEFILRNNSKLKSYIDDGRIFIDSIQGVRNLSNKISFMKQDFVK